MRIKKTFFKSILIGFVKDIIKEYDGLEIKDKYSYNKFGDGKWYTKSLNGGEYKEMQYLNLDIYDLTGEIESLLEGIIDSNYPLVFESKIKNTNII